MLLTLPAEEVSKQRDGNQQLLDQYRAAVCSRQAHELDAAMNACMARIGMDSASFAAARVIAGLTDPRVAAVQETIDRLNAAAQASRQAYTLGWAQQCHGGVGLPSAKHCVALWRDRWLLAA